MELNIVFLAAILGVLVSNVITIHLRVKRLEIKLKEHEGFSSTNERYYN